MARPCTLCHHDQRSAIDTALARGEPNRRVASRFGVTEVSTRRHKANHLPHLLAEAARQEDADLDAVVLSNLLRAVELGASGAQRVHDQGRWGSLGPILSAWTGSIKVLAEVARLHPGRADHVSVLLAVREAMLVLPPPLRVLLAERLDAIDIVDGVAKVTIDAPAASEADGVVVALPLEASELWPR
jgi:hypothetical protein